jgi:hypothetical protein
MIIKSIIDTLLAARLGAGQNHLSS